MDGIISSVPTAHSVALCFFVGPLGILVHWITKQLRAKKKKKPAAKGAA